MTEHIVTGCRDCPFCQEEAAEYFCLHPSDGDVFIEVDDSGDDLSYIEFPVTPHNCPLNQSPITIIKKT